ncbi:hypothetical protein [Streptacidiphilus melanogenes]|uniref:hypothetical protein n=1 Tax=Streptacidiphilus melanogenes TaxID=411235 RepID=UPI0005AB0C22|nr:hypothetical protein [Streptacidiphilus melanogenes]
MLDRSAVDHGHLPPATKQGAGRRCHGLAKKAAVALAVVSASFVAVPSAHAADCTPGSYPPAQCSALVSSTVVPQGGSLTVFGPGFAPGTSVSIDILSDVVHLRTVKAREGGWVRARVRIPDDFEEGTHTLMLTGRNPDGSARRLSATIEVVEARHGGAPWQPGDDGNGGNGGNGVPAHTDAFQGPGDGGHGEAGVLAHTGASGAAELGVVGGTLLGAGGLTLRLVRRHRRSRAS